MITWVITLPSWTSVQLLQNSALSNEVPPALRSLVPFDRHHGQSSLFTYAALGLTVPSDLTAPKYDSRSVVAP
ncbi:hypothetical protein QV65_06730 [Rhodococcus erythropolis]|nr:hypothetical protein QV65_06730 [Rhodococcus erythropolis]